MRVKEKSTTVYFVRHGQTDFPLDRIYCDDKEDPPLNEAGLRQARAAALYFRTRDVDAIYASPAMRTTQTAKEIASVVSRPISYSEKLRERRFGIWDGLYFDEIEKGFPEKFLEWKKDQVNFAPEGGETIPQLSARLNEVLAEVIKSHQGQSVVIVTHVGPIRVAVTEAFEMPLHQFRQIRVDYAGITRIDYGVSKNNLIKLNIVRYKG